MKSNSINPVVRAAAVAAVAAMGLVGSLACGTARGGDVSVGIGIRIGEPAPPPRPVVVRETTVVSYDTYVVGYRKNLYDADWRLRTAQVDEVEAQGALDAAKAHVGEVAVALDETEARAADLRRQLDGAGADVAELRVRARALEVRLKNAREDWDAAKVLRDPRGIADAERRFHENEAQLAGTVEALHRAEDAAAARGRLAEAEAELARVRADLDGANDAVFAARDRLAAAHERVCVALHDRDEALWLLYRDDIIVGRVRPEAVGFSINLAVFGGRFPRDPEVLHAHFVHDVGYWRERPVEIQTRVVAVDHVTEITRIREVQRTREVGAIARVEGFEASFTIEKRKAVAERVVVERQRYEVDRVERTRAAAEHRRPQVDPKEAAEAKATLIKAKADADAKKLAARGEYEKDHAEAKSIKAQGLAEARATKEQGHADAKATEAKAQADARATKEQAHADARSTEVKAKADARSQTAQAGADARATREQAHADARSTEVKAKADARSTREQGHADARATEVKAKSDARDSRTAPPRDPRAAKDNKNGKGRTDQASTDGR